MKLNDIVIEFTMFVDLRIVLVRVVENCFVTVRQKLKYWNFMKDTNMLCRSRKYPGSVVRWLSLFF